MIPSSSSSSCWNICTLTCLLCIFSCINRACVAFLPRGRSLACRRASSSRRATLQLEAAALSTDDKDETIPRVVIVGGGIGGLALASRLSNASVPACRVQIFEKNDKVGGRAGSVHVSTTPTSSGKLSSFRHETGPTLLLLPHIYRRIFDDCGTKSMEEYGLTIKPCIPAYQVVFDDGDCVNVGFSRQTNLSYEERQVMVKAEEKSRRKMDSWEKDGSLKWDAYLRACEAFLDCGLPNFIEEELDLVSFPPFLREALRDFGKAWPLKPHSDVLDAFFGSNKLKALASFQDLYVGLEPYRNERQALGGVLDSTAPAVFGLLSAIELHPDNKKCGVYAPIGGFSSVSSSLQTLAEENGVEIWTNRTVTRIASDGVWYRDDNNYQKDKVRFEPADLIIVNADLPYAKESLLRETDPTIEYFDWDEKYRYSSGVIAFHWSLGKSLDKLNTHNVFMSIKSRDDMEASWTTLRDPSTAPAMLEKETPFNFYVHRASNTDPTAAPEGMDSVMILVPCPILQRNPDMAEATRDDALAYYNSTICTEMIDAARDAVLHRLAVVEPDLKSHILHEFVDTPASYASSYNVAAGTPFALSHGLRQLSLLRPGPATGNLPNVLYVGASSRPGNGVPLVLVGAELTAKKAQNNLRNRFST